MLSAAICAYYFPQEWQTAQQRLINEVTAVVGVIVSLTEAGSRPSHSCFVRLLEMLLKELEVARR